MKHLSNLKFKSLVLCLAVAVMVCSAYAADFSCETGEIVTLRIKDYSSTGSSIYNELLSGQIYAVSYSWTSSNESYTTWPDKANTFAYVKFSQPGDYTIKFDLKYSFSGSTRSYKFTATWDISVTASTVYVTSVQVTPKSITLDPGDSRSLDYSVFPVYATDRSVRWRSDDTSVAVVDNYGNVTAKSYGNTYVRCTATDGSGCSGSCYVSVNKPVKKVTSVSIEGGDFSLEAGQSKTIAAKVLPNDATDKSLKWSTSNSSVAIVSSGKIEAVAPGVATITCTAADGSACSDSCMVTVTPVKDPVDDEIELYLVGEITKWEFNEYFKMSTTDYDTYTIFVNNLSGQFKIAAKGWEVDYGQEGISAPEIGKDYELKKMGSNITIADALRYVKLTFVRSTRTLRVENVLGSNDYCLVAFTTDNRSVAGIWVQKGETYYFPIAFLHDDDYDAWETIKAGVYDWNTQELVDCYLVADEAMMVFTVDRPVYVNWIVEYKSDVVQELTEEMKAKAVMIRGGVRMENLPPSSRIDVYGLDGVKRESYFNSESGGTQEIPLKRGSVSVLKLSNGQSFKVCN